MKKVLATLLAAGLVLSLASCGSKEPETSKKEKGTEPTAVVTEAKADQGWEGNYQSVDTEEHFKIYDVTDTGFKVEFYHFEEGLIEKFDYDMEFDNAEKTVASEKGTTEDNGGWEYLFSFGGDSITVNWQGNAQLYKRVS